MRVLALLHEYVPGHGAGAEWMTHTLLRSLVERGHEVDVVLSRGTGDPYEVDGVRVHPFRDKHDPFYYLDFCHVVVTHLENTTRASALASSHGVPVVHVLHNTFEPTKKWLSAGPCDLAVYNSEWMRADYEAWLDKRNKKRPPCIIVRPPVFADHYATDHGDQDRITLINLFEPKGAPIFWELAERMPDLRFLAVRGGYGEQDIRDLPNVEIVDNMPGEHMREKVYARTKILLMPSAYESWGRVGVEAMCSGIPVIANPTPGLRESLGEAGTFVDRDDLDGWETAIRHLLKPRIYGAQSKKALARAAELDPTEDLATWCDAIGLLGRRVVR